MKRILLFALAALSILSLSARQPEKGYRGFFDLAFSYRPELVYTLPDSSYDHYLYGGFSTSHGYQFNPNLYVGAGLGLEHNKSWDSNIVPIFLDVRTDQQFGKFTPFADLRLGFSATGGGGIYLSPSIGYRFNWGRKVGVNVAVGYTLQGYKVEMYDLENPGKDDLGYWQMIYLGKESHTNSYFSFRLGFDF